MSRPSVNPFVVAVFVTVAMLTGNVANNAQAGRSSAKVRSAKQALLKRQQTQKSKGLPQTVRVHRLNASRNNRGKILVVGRKKGELVQHPTLGPLRVDRVRAANPKVAEVRIIENTRNIDGTPNQLVVISDTVEYTNEPAKAGDVIRSMTKLGLGLGLAPTVTKEKASSVNVLRAAKTFAKRHGLVAQEVRRIRRLLSRSYGRKTRRRPKTAYDYRNLKGVSRYRTLRRASDSEAPTPRLTNSPGSCAPPSDACSQSK